MAGPIPSPPQSYLELVAACDNFQPTQSNEKLTTWRLTPDPLSPAIGLLRPAIVTQLLLENASSSGDRKPWAHFPEISTLSFALWVDTPTKRTEVMRGMLERWRDTGLWADVVGPSKWRGEMYPVYRAPFGQHDAPYDEDETLDDTRNYAFRMERAACALFGVVTYGVHMTVYVEDKGGCKIWVPKRAQTKQTWPGFYDNSVAGGIPAGLGVFESLVKESMEEASIAEEIVREHAKSVGSISYFFSTSQGWLQPEVEYLYDLRVPNDVSDPTPFQPKPLDGEVESFELLSLTEIIPKMRTGLFKTNCAAALVDFMIRHGYITPDNEPQFQEIVTRLHGRFDYDRW